MGFFLLNFPFMKPPLHYSLGNHYYSVILPLS